MNLSQQRMLPLAALLIAHAVLAGCSNSSNNPQVASLSDSSSAGTSAAENKASSTPSEPRRISADESTATESQPEAPQTSPRYTVNKPVTPPVAPKIPPVLLSASHAKLCTVNVGDAFPAINLPKLGGGQAELAALRGKQATVVVFWHPDRWMARTALIDMQRDVVAQFPADQIAVIGIAVQQPMGAVQTAMNQAQATFPQLIDSEGKALASVGTQSLPRIYVLDPAGKIVWFDIEYSEGTRRELWQTLRVLAR